MRFVIYKRNRNLFLFYEKFIAQVFPFFCLIKNHSVDFAFFLRYKKYSLNFYVLLNYRFLKLVEKFLNSP